MTKSNEVVDASAERAGRTSEVIAAAHGTQPRALDRGPDVGQAHPLAARCADLQNLAREQQELVQFIVHDLRTPLMVVQMSLAYVAESMVNDPAETRDALRDASESMVRVMDLVSDLLSVSRLEEARMPLDRSHVDLVRLIEGIASHYRPRVAGRAIILESHVAPLTLVADAALLRRVVENLVDNSLRHTPPSGRVRLDASMRDGLVRVVISNTGPPVPRDDRVSIFERFSRGSSPASVPGAVGLGLYFCRRVAEAHGGLMEIEDVPPWPTSFVLTLPAH